MRVNFEFSNQLQLEIVYGAVVDLDHRWQRKQVRDGYTRLYFVQSGEGYLCQGGRKIKLESGFMYLIPAHCRFDYGCTQLKKLYFHVMLTAVKGIDLLSAIPEICKIPCSGKELEDLIRWSNSKDYADILRLKSQLFQKIREAMETCEMPLVPVQEHSQIVARAIDFIQENVRLNLNAKEIAQALFVSESKLRKDFRNETGMSLGKYVDNMVFLVAKQMLAEKALSIGQISQRLGFCDQFYFARRFKEIFRETPSEFRKELF